MPDEEDLTPGELDEINAITGTSPDPSENNPSPEVNVQDILNIHFNPNFNFKFSGKLEFNPKFVVNPRYKIYLINKVINEHYYFDPIYFKWDAGNRVIYTIDDKIQLRLNFNFVLIDQRYLFFILTLMQLDLLNVITEAQSRRLIELICGYLNIKFEYRYLKKKVVFKRFVGGKEIERIECDLTSEEFEKEVLAQLSKLRISYSNNGFIYDST